MLKGLRSISLFFFVLSLVSAMLFFACAKTTPPEPEPLPSKPIQLPIDLVMCIDASRSITPTEQELIRETAMMLGDLAEKGDRITIVAFGEGARQVASQEFQGDLEERYRFHDAVRNNLQFTDLLSDLGAAIEFLAEQGGSLFRPPDQAKRAVVFLSDGRLEPVTGEPGDVLRQIYDSLAKQLSGIDFYAVVLGETYSRSKVPGLELTGRDLMADYIARSPERLFEAKTLDNLLDICWLILERLKELPPSGETAASEFKVDKSVTSFTLIVKKRDADGTERLKSSDLELSWPEKKRGDLVLPGLSTLPGTQSSVYWNDQYAYFDLITVQSPSEGSWRIASRQAQSLQCLHRLSTPIELRWDARSSYFTDETAYLTAFIYNRNEGTPVPGSFKITAHVKRDPSAQEPAGSLQLESIPEQNQYRLEVPRQIVDLISDDSPPEKASLSLIAEQEDDPWFYRSSPPIQIEFLPPFMTWTALPEKLRYVPVVRIFWPKAGDFHAELQASAPRAPSFVSPPAILFELEKFDPETGHYNLAVSAKVEDADEQAEARQLLAEGGSFRYSYQVQGNTRDGPFEIRSSYYTIQAKSLGWAVWTILLLIVIFLVLAFLRQRPRISGIRRAQKPKYEIRCPGQKIVSKPIRGKSIIVEVAVAKARFSLTVNCSWLLMISIGFKVLQGSVIVKGKKYDRGQSDKFRRFPAQIRCPLPKGRGEALVDFPGVRIKRF